MSCSPLIHCRIKKHKAYFPLLSDGGGVGGIRCARQRSCSEIKRGRFASGNWHFILASKKFILFLFFLFLPSFYWGKRTQTAVQADGLVTRKARDPSELSSASVGPWVGSITEPEVALSPYHLVPRCSPLSLESFKKNFELTRLAVLFL